ncbi:MAG: hypothetical protein EON87_04950 [Brevundimonas sp.]|nr:MAG: hypothetical protein EON87_04950 [Brevundimonas sp.]
MPGLLRLALALIFATAALGGAPPPAVACSVRPFTPEERLAWQADLWRQSETVYLARIDRLRSFRDAQGRPGRRGVLVPIAVLKGGGPIPWVSLSATSETSCGIMISALSGEQGDRFLVYSADRGARVTSRVRTLALEDVVDPHARRALRGVRR